MTLSEEYHVQLFKELFIGKTDFYWEYKIGSSPFVVYRDYNNKAKENLVSLTDDDIMLHLQGKKIIGVSPFITDDKVKWGCIDIDIHYKEGAEPSLEQQEDDILKAKNAMIEIYYALKELGFTVIVDTCDQRGWHIIVLQREGEAKAVRYFLKNLLKKLFNNPEKFEIFPKQDKLSDTPNGFGNQVKLHLSLHPKKQKYVTIFDVENMMQLSKEESLEYLEKIDIIKIKDIEYNVENDKEYQEKVQSKKDYANRDKAKTPLYCAFIEEIASLKELPSDGKTRHHHLDPNVGVYCHDNNKLDLKQKYLKVQGRTSATAVDNWPATHNFNCGQIINYCRHHNIQEGLDCCKKCNESKIEDDNYDWDELPIKSFFSKVWERFVVGQPVWKRMIFYSKIGSLLTEEGFDLRVQLCFSSYTSSGKGEGITTAINLYELIIQALLFELILVAKKAIKPDEFTDAALVGHIDELATRYNRKYGLTPEVPEKQVKIRGKFDTVNYIDPVVKGYGHSNDLIVFDECENILKSPDTKFNQNTLRMIRSLMDRNHTYEKHLRDGKIVLNTPITFILCTFPLEEFEDITETGLLQRCLFYHSPMTDSKHDKILEHTVNNFFGEQENSYAKSLDGLEDTKHYLCEIVKIYKWFVENKGELADIRNEDIKLFVEKKLKEYESSLKGLSRKDRNVLLAELRRGVRIISNIAKIERILHMRKNVIIQDVEIAVSLYLQCIDSLRFYLKSSRINSEHVKKLYQLLDEHPEGINKMVLNTLLQNRLNKGETTISNLFKAWEEAGIIKVKKEGNEHLVLKGVIQDED